MTVLLTESLKTSSSHMIEIWTINRPDKLNALNSQVLKRIFEEGERLLELLTQKPTERRALILRGAGEKAFVAGADIAEMREMSREEAEKFSRLGQMAFGRLEELPIPTFAALQGFALGGGLELAMACDIVIATQDCQLGQPEAHLGLIPGFGATARFVDRLGTAKALELLFSGRRISAQEALDLRLIERLAPQGTPVFDFTLKVAEEMIAKSSPQAIASIKKLVRTQTSSRFSQATNLEAQAFGAAFETKDKKEGVDAFLSKRPTRF